MVAAPASCPCSVELLADARRSRPRRSPGVWSGCARGRRDRGLQARVALGQVALDQRDHPPPRHPVLPGDLALGPALDQHRRDDQLRHPHRPPLVSRCERCPETAVNDVLNSDTTSTANAQRVLPAQTGSIGTRVRVDSDKVTYWPRILPSRWVGRRYRSPGHAPNALRVDAQRSVSVSRRITVQFARRRRRGSSLVLRSAASAPTASRTVVAPALGRVGNTSRSPYLVKRGKNPCEESRRAVVMLAAASTLAVPSAAHASGVCLETSNLEFSPPLTVNDAPPGAVLKINYTKTCVQSNGMIQLQRLRSPVRLHLELLARLRRIGNGDRRGYDVHQRQQDRKVVPQLGESVQLRGGTVPGLEDRLTATVIPAEPHRAFVFRAYVNRSTARSACRAVDLGRAGSTGSSCRCRRTCCPTGR